MVIAENSARRGKEEHLTKSQRQALRRARRSQQSQSGRQLMRMRGQHIERSFAHILDCGGMLKTTLRGQVNLQKRYNFAAACYNLSQLLRKKFGCGTLKGAVAANCRGLFWSLAHIVGTMKAIRLLYAIAVRFFSPRTALLRCSRMNPNTTGFSTAC